jgi:hypothetical protein
MAAAVVVRPHHPHPLRRCRCLPLSRRGGGGIYVCVYADGPVHKMIKKGDLKKKVRKSDFCTEQTGLMMKFLFPTLFYFRNALILTITSVIVSFFFLLSLCGKS